MPRKKNQLPTSTLYGGRLNHNPQPAPETRAEITRYPGMAMSVEVMADELDIGRNVAYQLVQQPGFPAFTIGRRVLVSRKGLQEWIDSQCKNRSNVIEESEP